MTPWNIFHSLITKYLDDFNIRTFSYLDQFLCMAFAQMFYRESLLDIRRVSTRTEVRHEITNSWINTPTGHLLEHS